MAATQFASFTLDQFNQYCDDPQSVRPTFDQAVETPAIVAQAIAQDIAAEAREMAHQYFKGTIELCNITKAVSVDFARALYGALTDAREACRKAGNNKLVQKVYTIQYRVLPNFFHAEKRQGKPVPVAQPTPVQQSEPVKDGKFEDIKHKFLEACRAGQQAKAAGYKSVIHRNYPQFEYAADRALAHYFPKK